MSNTNEILKIRKYRAISDNEHNTYKNSTNAVKAVHSGKCIALS